MLEFSGFPNCYDNLKIPPSFPLTGFHAHEATVHCKQGETKKAKGEASREKKGLSCRAGEKGRKTTTETERRKEKDFQNVGKSRTTEKENMIAIKFIILSVNLFAFLVKSWV